MEQYRVTDIQAMSGLMRISRALDKSDASLMAALTTLEAFIAQSSSEAGKQSALSKATGLSDDALALPIEALGLSGKALSALKTQKYEEYIPERYGYISRNVKTETVADIMVAGRERLLRIREFGTTSYRELMAAIERLKPGSADVRSSEVSEEARRGAMALAIDELEVSVRAWGACVAAHVETLGDLSKLSAKRLYEFPNVGKGTIRELGDLLAAHGLKFSPDKRGAA